MQEPSGSSSPSTLRHESLPLRNAQQSGPEAPAGEASSRPDTHNENDNGTRASAAATGSDELIQSVVCDGRAISSLLADSLRQNTLANNDESSLSRILRLAEELRSFQSPVEFTIG